EPDAVHVDLVLDRAEIPTYRERQSAIDRDGDGTVSTGEQAAYRAATCARLAGAAALTVSGAAVPFSVDSSALEFPPGQAGLVACRLTWGLTAPARSDRPTRVTYRIGAYADQIGWREVVAVGDWTTLVHSDVPATSRSARLTSYPPDLLSAPLDQRSATL